MDKELIKDCFSRAVPTYEKAAQAQGQIARKMADLLEMYLPSSVETILEIGCGTGFFSRLLVERLQPRRMVLNDICPGMQGCVQDLLGDKVAFCPGDAEKMAFPGGQDVIVSCSALQWFVSPARFFVECLSFLNTGGYLAFSTFGKKNLKEIALLTGNSLPYYSQAELEEMLADKYELVHSEEEQITLFFPTPLEVLYHLKQTGVTAVRSGRSWTRNELQKFTESYYRQFGRGTQVILTYHPIYLIARKKQKS